MIIIEQCNEIIKELEKEHEHIVINWGDIFRPLGGNK